MSLPTNPNILSKAEIPKDPQEKIANSKLLGMWNISIESYAEVVDARLGAIAKNHLTYFKSSKFGFSFNPLVGQEITLFDRFYSELNGEVGTSMRADIREGFSKSLSGSDLNKAVDEHILILSFILARASTNLKTSTDGLKFDVKEEGMLVICSGIGCLSADMLKELRVEGKSAMPLKSATPPNKWLDLAKNGKFGEGDYEERFGKGSWANLQKVATSIYKAYLSVVNQNLVPHHERNPRALARG